MAEELNEKHRLKCAFYHAEASAEYLKWLYILRSSAKCDLALSALREWHYLLIALALKYELALSALREWHNILLTFRNRCFFLHVIWAFFLFGYFFIREVFFFFSRQAV